jgi:hypothetical protein
MTIHFLCPRGHKLAVPDNLAGKKGRCPICQQRVYIPLPELQDDTVEAPPPPPVVVSAPSAAAAPSESMENPSPEASQNPPAEAPADSIAPPGAGGDSAVSTSFDDAATADASVEPFPQTPGPPPIPPPIDGTSGDAPPIPPPSQAGGADWSDAPVLPPPAGPPNEHAVTELSVIIDEPEGYQADPGKVQTAYLLAVALGILTLLCAAPAILHINLIEAPNWARVVLIAAGLQLAFICWMASLPDWSTVWITMVVFAIVAALYGVAWAVLTFTPSDMPLGFLDLEPDDPIRHRAGPWCLVMLMLFTLLTYACGRFSGRWRKQYELAKAMRE